VERAICQLGSRHDGSKLVVPDGRERQKLTGTEVISRKILTYSGYDPEPARWRLQLAPTGGSGRRKRLTGKPLDQIDDQKQDNRANCGRNNGANNASAEGQTEP